MKILKDILCGITVVTSVIMLLCLVFIDGLADGVYPYWISQVGIACIVSCPVLGIISSILSLGVK